MSWWPSLTAIQVMGGVLAVADHAPYRGWLPPDFVDYAGPLLASTGFVPRWAQRRFRSRGFGRVVWTAGQFERWAVRHLVLRKRAVYDEVMTAVGAGATQVVVIGAGFDVVSLQVANTHPSVRVVELDHPATQPAKQRALEAAGLLRPNLHLVGADLAERSVDEALRDVPGWDPAAPTVAVAEGLLMYLSEPAAEALFGGMARATGPSSRLVFTYAPASDTGRPHLAWAIRLGTAAIGERMKWHPAAGTLGDWLSAQGWALDGPEARDLHAIYAGSPSPFRGECLAVATRE